MIELHLEELNDPGIHKSIQLKLSNRIYLRKCLEQIITAINRYPDNSKLSITRQIKIKICEPYTLLCVKIQITGDSEMDIFHKNPDLSYPILKHHPEKLWSTGTEYSRLCDALNFTEVRLREVFLLNEKSPLGERIRVHPSYVTFESNGQDQVDTLDQFEWSTLSEMSFRFDFYIEDPFEEKKFVEQLNDFKSLLFSRLAMLRLYDVDISQGMSTLYLDDNGSLLESQCLDEEVDYLLKSSNQ